MNTFEIADAVSRLKGLFPLTTKEQIDFWADKFEQYPSAAVNKAIDHYADLHSGEVDRPNLVRMIEDYERGDPDNRRKAAVNLVEEVRQQRAAEFEKTQQSWSEIDRTIGALTDEDLADLKATALEQSRKLNDGAKKMLAKMNPRTSKTLRILIVQFLKYQGRTVAHACLRSADSDG